MQVIKHKSANITLLEKKNIAGF